MKCYASLEIQGGYPEIMNCFGQNLNNFEYYALFSLLHCGEVVGWGKHFAVLEKVKKGNNANPGLKKMSSEDSQRYL